jgi:hypothetical protein
MDRHRLTYAPDANARNDASGDSTSTTGATVPKRAPQNDASGVSPIAGSGAFAIVAGPQVGDAVVYRRWVVGTLWSDR